MSFNYSKLKGRIKEKYSTQSAFANSLGISTVSLYAKINNRDEFSQSEMLKCCDLLKIPKKNIPDFFYAES